MISNRKYKDGVFADLFSQKDNLLELYHALSGFDYSKETKVEIITLDGVLFTPLKNDLAAFIEDRFVVLMEHQSTLSNNIPIRMFLYLAREYEKLLKEETLYKKKRVWVPTPELYVLYNGTDPCPKEQILKLSDSFLVKKELPMVELQVKQININYGINDSLLKKSQKLHDYSYLVQTVRNFLKKGMTRDEAITLALELCVKQGILQNYLRQKGSEVLNMLLMEYNEEIALRVTKEEAREDGLLEGRKEGRREGRKEGILSVIEICRELNLPEDEIKRKLQEKFHLTEEEIEEFLKETVK